MKCFVGIVLLGLAIVLISCIPRTDTNQTANANSNAASNAKWDAYVEQFLTDYFTANPTFAVYQGRHEFDGKFPNWSADGLSREIARSEERTR